MILNFLAIFGLQFLICQSDGPFGIIASFRNWLFQSEYFGVFFYKLLTCPFCSGCWSGLVIYLITENPIKLSLSLIWFLTGGSICLIINTAIDYLNRD